MILSPANLAIKTALSFSFLASGGTPPYTYSVAPGGAGGTINPATGLYTSPAGIGADTIIATDSLAATANSTVLVGTPLELVCDIIATDMTLPAGRVWLWDQKIMEPKDQSIYIPIRVLSLKSFGNSKLYDGSGPGLDEVKSTNMVATLSIDVKSRDYSAVLRKEEILQALASTYADQQMELNSFRVFNIPQSFSDLSELDGAAIPYRFNIVVNLQFFVSKITAVPYYSIIGKPSLLEDS